MDNAGLQSLLKRLCNVLWSANVTNPITYVTQISYLLFLKMLEEMEAEQRDANSTNGRTVGSYPPIGSRLSDTAISSLCGSLRTRRHDVPLPPINPTVHLPTISTAKATASPPPMHRQAMPRLPPVRFKPLSRVTRIRAPPAPIGWPSATAPP